MDGEAWADGPLPMQDSGTRSELISEESLEEVDIEMREASLSRSPSSGPFSLGGEGRRGERQGQKGTVSDGPDSPLRPPRCKRRKRGSFPEELDSSPMFQDGEGEGEGRDFQMERDALGEEGPRLLTKSIVSTPAVPLRSTGRGKAKSVEAWEEIKYALLNDGLALLTPDVPHRLDLVKFWGFILIHLRLPMVPTIALDKRRKDVIIDKLDG